MEAESLGPELYGAVQVLKTFLVYKCPHSEESISAAHCVKSMVGQKLAPQKSKSSNSEVPESPDVPAPSRSNDPIRFIPATQDHYLRKQLRQLPGTPLLYLNGPAPHFERPSLVTQEVAKDKSVKKLEVITYQKEILDRMKDEVTY